MMKIIRKASEANPDSVIVIPPSLSVDRVDCPNSYLFETAGKVVLIELPTLAAYPFWLAALKERIAPADIDYLIVQTVDLTTGNVLEAWHKDGFARLVYTAKNLVSSLKAVVPDLEVISIEDAGHQLLIDGRLVLRFFNVKYLPAPSQLMSYWVTRGFLFSGPLFSNAEPQTSNDLAAAKRSIATFHKATMPSSEYLKAPLRQITHLAIYAIYPSYGRFFAQAEVPAIIEHEYHLDFYNSQQVYKTNALGEKEINFIELGNSLINKLLKDWSKEKVVAVFANSSFVLDETSCEIKDTSLTGYKLYNALFDQIYLKTGREGFLLLEPLVNFYNTQYGVTRPSVYTSKLAEIESGSQAAAAEKKALEKKLGELQTALEKTESRLLKDSNTGLYNEYFFKGLLDEDLANLPNAPYVRGFVRVKIDQLQDINQRYGNLVGDESLRHLQYLIGQMKLENALTIKLNGPDVLLYVKVTTAERLKALAIRLRNDVAASKLFIERVSVSLAVVTSDELASVSLPSEKYRQLLLLLARRVRFAQRQGGGQIVNSDTDAETSTDGYVLLIDEDDVNRNMLTRIFKRINLEVLTAPDVIEARKVLERQPIDIIISEINLAKIDGFAFKQSLNESQKFANIPFIMVSHSKTVANIRRANLLNVDCMLEKPVVPEELLGHVMRLRSRKQALL
ncbi:MAG: response regulator [Bacilli bacterium]|jgi:diguanylate cyclase (GGDEF)-like protein